MNDLPITLQWYDNRQLRERRELEDIHVQSQSALSQIGISEVERLKLELADAILQQEINAKSGQWVSVVGHAARVVQIVDMLREIR